MNVLITGGCGYIGSHLAFLLVKKNIKTVSIIDNLSNSKKEVLGIIEKITKKKIYFKKIDILKKNSLEKFFFKNKFDVVYHFAAVKAVGESQINPLKYYNVNIAGLINLLDVMNKHEVKKIIFSSSSTVYGNPKSLPLKETSELSPENVYGYTKKIGEEIIQNMCKYHGFKSVILRYFNPAGAHYSGLFGEQSKGAFKNLFPAIIDVLSKKKKFLKIYGKNYNTRDGTGARDFIHVEDLVFAHFKAMKLISKKCEVINLGLGKSYTVMEVVKAFERVNNIKIKYKFFARRSGDIAESYNSVSKQNKILNWSPDKNIEDICKTAYDFYKKTNK